MKPPSRAIYLLRVASDLLTGGNLYTIISIDEREYENFFFREEALEKRLKAFSKLAYKQNSSTQLVEALFKNFNLNN